MRIGRHGTLLGLALLALGGCAGMSAEECALSDWRAVGYEDGSLGYTADRLGDHRRACAEHGYTPDFEAYRAGREEGLRLYCQPSRGFSIGSNGGRYQGVCAADLEPGFLDGYHAGVELHTLRGNVNAANDRIYASQQELERTKELIRSKEAALIADETTTQDRILLLADLKELAERTGQLEAEIDLAIEDRARHEERLAAYQASLPYSGY